MPIKLTNNASGTLATAISASDTGVALTTGDGAEFPTLGASEYFYATVTSSGGTQEIVKATARSGDSLTIVRAQEGTSAASFAAGARFELRVTAQSVLDAVGDVVASQVGFTPTGGIAATDVQAALAEVDTEKVAFTRLDDSDGASLLGFLQSGTGAVATTVQSKLREFVSRADYDSDANYNTARNALTGRADHRVRTETGTTDRLLSAKLGDTVSVRDFGAVASSATDDTAAFTAALAASNSVYVPAGTYRIDGTITIFSNKALFLDPAAKLIRLSAHSANTAPVVHLRGSYSRLDGGTIESQNNSPGGVVALGHLNHTSSNWNSLFWRFSNCDVFAKDFGGSGAAPYPAITDGVGVYIPSSQPNLGSSFANYFGECSNVRVYNATIGWYLTDLANSHTLVNCTVEFFYWRAFQLNGAYGNTFYGGFINGCYSGNKIAILLDGKLYPAAPYASTLQSMWNHFFGSAMELYTAGMVGVQCNVNNSNNLIQFSWNSTGTSYIDNDGSNTIIESRIAQYPKLATVQIDGIGVGQTQEVFIAPKFLNGTVYGIRVSGGAEVTPNVDNAINLGKGAFRYGVVYAGTGTINTSDEREKKDIAELDAAEKRVAVALKGLVKKFRFKDAVEKKGDNARIHVGVIAQEVMAAFQAEGIDPMKYGIVCHDVWDELPEIRDDGGDLIQEARAAGNRYGVRYEELLAFIIAAL